MRFEEFELRLPEPVLQEVVETLAPHLRPEAQRAAIREALWKVVALIGTEAVAQVQQRYKLVER